MELIVKMISGLLLAQFVEKQNVRQTIQHNSVFSFIAKHNHLFLFLTFQLFYCWWHFLHVFSNLLFSLYEGWNLYFMEIILQYKTFFADKQLREIWAMSKPVFMKK